MRVLLVLMLLAATAFGADGPVVAPPKGRKVAVVDHSKPKACLAIAKKTGKTTAIKKVAAALKADDDVQTLRNIHAHIASLPHIPHRGWLPDHQDFATLSNGFDQNDCARHALLFGSLTRAAGIPTVYVKSMRHTWIRTFVETGETGSFSGHVFLELYIDGTWRLLDAQGMRLWDEYDPAVPELPGGLLAYEKGIDYVAMVHSTQRDQFIEEAKQRFADVKLDRLRPNSIEPRRLLRDIFALTLVTEWKALGERVSGMPTFNVHAWPEKRDTVRGNVLVVTSMGGRVGLPDDEIDDWLPLSKKQLAADFAARKSGVHTRTLEDGTLVVLLAAPGWHELHGLIATTPFVTYRCAAVE